VLPQGWLLSFVRDEVISGVGSVLVFLPQILTSFSSILLLEDFGYTARAAFLLDRIMGGPGLHGRAFIPLLSSFACTIPGYYGDAGPLQPPRTPRNDPRCAADDLLGRVFRSIP
jgi:Fe2+ transport system protein B